MKKTVFLLVGLFLFIYGCSHHPAQDSTFKSTIQESVAERDSALENWPFPGAKGNYIPSRDGLENSDTIVDGFPYNHV